MAHSMGPIPYTMADTYTVVVRKGSRKCKVIQIRPRKSRYVSSEFLPEPAGSKGMSGKRAKGKNVPKLLKYDNFE